MKPASLPFSWLCPFCGQHGLISEPNYSFEERIFELPKPLGPHGLYHEAIVCPNPGCGKFTLRAELATVFRAGTGYGTLAIIKEWKLIPESDAKAFPDYIPESIRKNYLEACLIRDLSAKASATLARRCLQAMIRDFWQVHGKRTLAQEIEAIRDRVDPLTWQAIDAVRKVGNIAAHMEEDPNLLVDVDPEEAAQLIGLIELLFRDWYINRHERQEYLTALKELGDAKSQRIP